MEIIEKTTVDTKGRVMIPTSIRKKWGIKEGVIILFEEKDNEILLKPERKKSVSLKDLCGLSPKRTGEPKWMTPEEIKCIWEPCPRGGSSSSSYRSTLSTHVPESNINSTPKFLRSS